MKNWIRLNLTLLLLIVAVTGASAYAQEEEEEASPFGIELAEGTRLRSALEVGANYSDNFFYARDGATQEVFGLQVRPLLRFARAVPRFRFYAGASSTIGWFDEPGTADDYTDYSFNLGSAWEPAQRHSLSFNTRLKSSHDPFGTERTEGTPLEDREIDEWRSVSTSVRYFVGLPGDRFNYELTAGGANKEYTNNREVTQFLDYESVNSAFTTYLNLSSKSAVYVRFYGSRSYYEEIAPNAFGRGATTLRYLVGAKWQASAKTAGDLHVGYVSRDPRDSRRSEFQRFDWTGRLTWAPVTMRQFVLETGRRTQESYLNNVDFIDNRYAALIWTEQWTARTQTRATLSFIKSDFFGSQRNDELLGYALAAEYRLSPQLALLGTLSQGERDSNFPARDFDRLQAYLGARYAR